MRIYVSLANHWFVKNLEPVLRVLLERGHDIVLGLCGESGDRARAEALPSCLMQRVELAEPPSRSDQWTPGAAWLRDTIDYLFFLGPAFDGAPYSRLRRKAELSELTRHLIRRHHLRYGWRRRAALWWLQRVEEAVPPDPAILAHFREHRPDVLVISPLLGPEVDQYEQLRAAKALGIPTVFAVHSWDNLSSKGLIRMRPERIVVWNEIQRQETAKLHGQSRRRVAVCGAYPFDDWFQMRPSSDRNAFLRRVGLPLKFADRPLVLYLCSALYFSKAQPETEFVRDWLSALRNAADRRLAEALVLIRPHPKRADELALAKFLKSDRASVAWPSHGEAPIGAERQRAFFDSLYHADFVVGLNTSAMIEAGMLGKPVHTVLDSRYAVSQQGTLHFSYLADPDSGLLRISRGLDEHVAQLSASLASPAEAARVRQFVCDFVRPRGLDRPSAPIVADVVEQVGRRRRVAGLPGRHLARFALPWLNELVTRSQQREQPVAWVRAQKLNDWYARQRFLAALCERWDSQT